MKLSDGTERLLCVNLLAAKDLQRVAPGTTIRSYAVQSRRLIVAQLYRKDSRGIALEPISAVALRVEQADRQSVFRGRESERQATITWTKLGSWENGRVEFELRDIFQFLVGQADKADPTRTPNLLRPSRREHASDRMPIGQGVFGAALLFTTQALSIY